MYYVSNNNSEELYLRTQFVLVPHVVLKKVYNDIPKDSFILVVKNKLTFYYDKNANPGDTYMLVDSLFHFPNALVSDSDQFYNITLFKK